MSSWDNTQVMVTMLIHTRSYNNHGRWQHKGTRLEEESQSKADTLQKAEQALWTQVHGAKAGGTMLGRWCLVTAWWRLSCCPLHPGVDSGDATTILTSQSMRMQRPWRELIVLLSREENR